MDQLQDERSPGYDTSPTGKQVSAHQALQYRALTAALETQNTHKVMSLVRDTSRRVDTFQSSKIDF